MSGRDSGYFGRGALRVNGYGSDDSQNARVKEVGRVAVLPRGWSNSYEYFGENNWESWVKEMGGR